MNRVRSMYLYVCLTLIIMAGVGLFAFKPFTAEAAEAEHEHNGITFTAWESTTSLPYTAGYYYLVDDVTLSMGWSPSVSITLCLNGHSIDYNGSYPVIDVYFNTATNSSGILDIYDCQGSGTVTSGSSYTMVIDKGCTANIYGGKFINNNARATIRNNGGTLNMSGGEITYTNGGYGITNASGTAHLKNVKIIYVGSNNDDSGIYSPNGGAITTVEDCEIESGTGECIYVFYGTLKIIGGKFNGGYGIYNYGATIELSGSPTFTCSTADIYLYSNQKITVTGPLDNTTPYSVLTRTKPTEGNPVVFTDSSTTSYNDATKFKAAEDGYIVRKNSSGQLELAVLETYTITYNAGSYGSGSVSSGTKTEGTDITLSSQTFTRTGYTQTGWSTTDGGEKAYDLGGTYTDDASITLYPYWTANEYTVSFNSAGGSSVSTTMKVTYDSAYGTLPETTRAGYTFDGWYTAETGGTKVESTTKVTIADNHTLYAKWTANEYSITYMDQGGAAFSGTHESDYPTKHTYGKITTLKSASKTGFTFGGWYTNSSCTGSAVTSLGATGYTSDITLYAKWTANQYTVTLKYQDGRSEDKKITVTYGSTYGSDLPSEPSRAGYQFAGWFTQEEGGDKVDSNSTVTTAQDHTLFAQWTRASYTVTFNYNGADGGDNDESKSVTFGEAYGDLPTPTKTGHSFGGWYTEDDGNGTKITSSTIVEITEDTTLYAYWTECDHSNGNWGSWTYDETTHSHVCLNCGKTVTEEHSWNLDNGTVTKEPTCTEKGTTTYPCVDNCGATHDEIDVDMIPHDFSGAYIEDVNGDGHYRECEICGTPSDTVPHDWNEGTFTLGNCTTRSQTDFVCNSCGAEKTEYGDIVPDVHDWFDNGYDEQGHHLECSRCGETEISDHIWDEGTIDFEPTCVSKGQLTQHCTVAGCSETKTVEIDINPAAHKWSSEWESDESEHRRICENGCGETYSAIHTWNNGETTKEPTCTEAGEITFTCTECGYSRTETTESKGHDFSEAWSFDENGHWHECLYDDEKGEIIPHIETSEITTQPTPTEDGLITYSCETCGYVIRTEVIPATGGTSNRPSNSNNQTSNTDTSVPAKDSETLLKAVIDADNGDTVKADFSTDSVTISKEVFEAAAGKDIILEIRLKDMYWTINGRDIENPQEVNLGASKKNKAIPQSEIKAVAGDDPYIPLSLEYDGEFGFKGILNISTDKYEGRYANLYYYTNGKLELLGYSKISGGYMRFAFRHASDYLMVISDEPYGDDISFDIDYYNSEDVSSAAGIFAGNELFGDTVPTADMFIPAGIVLISMAFIIRKRSKAGK